MKKISIPLLVFLEFSSLSIQAGHNLNWIGETVEVKIANKLIKNMLNRNEHGISALLRRAHQIIDIKTLLSQLDEIETLAKTATIKVLRPDAPLFLLKNLSDISRYPLKNTISTLREIITHRIAQAERTLEKKEKSQKSKEN